MSGEEDTESDSKLSGAPPGNTAEVSVMSASDLTLSDHTLSPSPEEKEERPSQTSSDEPVDSHGGITSQQQDQDTEGVTVQSQQQDTKGTKSQDHEGIVPLPKAENLHEQEEAETTLHLQDNEEPSSQPLDNEGNSPAGETHPQDNEGTMSAGETPPPQAEDVKTKDSKGATSVGEEWQDILGSGQLMKKVWC